MTYTEFIAFLKEIVLPLTAITGAIVAVMGLNTWKRQLKSQSEHDLSRRILVALYKYREKIDTVRFPGMWPHEIPSPPDDEAQNMSDEEKQSYVRSKAYQLKWDKVCSERISLNAHLLEAEAMWDGEFKKLFYKIFDLEFELFICISQDTGIHYPDEASKETLRSTVIKKRDIRFDYLGGKPDDFKQELNIAIEKIEKSLKPKLLSSKV